MFNRDHISGSDTLTFLIHGFNVPKDDAILAYQSFASNIPEDRRRDFVWVYWPGDLHELRWRSIVSFPDAVDRAKLCAKYLAEDLSKRFEENDNVTTVRIVAHSLGCRLTLELLDRLYAAKQSGRIKVAMVALMAAAVPMWLVIEGKPSKEAGAKDAVDEAAALRLSDTGGDPTLILHSKDDWVLKSVFKLGARGESSSLRTLFGNRHALGRFGFRDSPKDDRVVEHDLAPLDHSDYWGSRASAAYIRPHLPSRLERDMPERHVL